MVYIRTFCDYFTQETINKLMQVFFSLYLLRIRSFQLNCLSMEEIYDLNSRTLNHNYYTDVITFYNKKKNFIDIEMYLCLQYVEMASNTANTQLEYEYVRTFYHGLLHCVGFNDFEELEKMQMKIKEEELCDKYFKFHVKHEQNGQ